MLNVVYNAFKANMALGKFGDLSSLVRTDIKVALVNDTYATTFSDETKRDNHATFAEVVANEIPAGNGYTARGKVVTGPTVTLDSVTNNWAAYDFADVSWNPSSITASGAVLYLDSSVNSTSYLICYIDFGGSKSSSAGAFTIQWNTAGVLTLA